MKILKTRKINVTDLPGVSQSSSNQNAKRQLREPLLKAFDIYKTNVHYGVMVETVEEHNTILSWYKDLCDLKESALENIPAKIKKYV